MSISFTKLFSSITESTIWQEPDSTRIVWITMLAIADRRGRVWASVPGLAYRARVPVEACRAALVTLLSPDPDSRTKEKDGRRISEIDGGWQLLNYEKYKWIRDDETKKEWKRNYINRRREALRELGGDGTSLHVDQCRPTALLYPKAEAEAEADTTYASKGLDFSDPKMHISPHTRPISSDASPKSSYRKTKLTSRTPISDIDAVYWAYPRKIRPVAARKAIEKAVSRLMAGEEKMAPMDRQAAILHLVERASTFGKSPAGDPKSNFTPHPATWFNAGGYHDGEAEWFKTGESNGRAGESKANSDQKARADSLRVARERTLAKYATDDPEYSQENHVDTGAVDANDRRPDGSESAGTGVRVSQSPSRTGVFLGPRRPKFGP